MSTSGIDMEDRLEILDLLARYNHFFDERQAEQWADCFTPDGRFSGPVGGASGRDELVAFCRRVSPPEGGVLHLTDHHLFEWDGDIVRHRCVLSVQSRTTRGVRTLLFRYRDELVQYDGAWKFRSRSVDDA